VNFVIDVFLKKQIIKIFNKNHKVSLGLVEMKEFSKNLGEL